jgi:hypothetical protein
MPRKGFKSVTLPEDLYLRLQDRAKLYGTTVQGIIKIALSDEKNTIREPLHGGGRRFESGSAHYTTHLREAFNKKSNLSLKN